MGEHKELSLDLTVRFRDIDAMGHVNNAVFFTYFEEGRKAFLEEVLGIHEPSEYPFILAHVHCDYVKPIRLGDSLCIHVRIGVVGSRKFSFKYKITVRNQASKIYATGESVMVLFDYEQNKSVPIPADILEKISPYRE